MFFKHLVQPVVEGRIPIRLQVVVAEMEVCNNLFEAVPGHDVRHHAVAEGPLPVHAEAGQGNHAHVQQDANHLPDFLFTEGRNVLVSADALRGSEKEISNENLGLVHTVPVYNYIFFLNYS